MIKDPSPAIYLKVSLIASLGTIAVIFGIIFIPQMLSHSAPVLVESLLCDSPSNADTVGWVEIPAGSRAHLRVPPAMQPALDPRAGPPRSSSWGNPAGSLAVTIVNARRSDRRWPPARGIDPAIGGHGDERACPMPPIDGHAATLQTSYFSSEYGRAYFEVFAQIDDHADSVIRVTVTANNQQLQRVGLTIVRSLRFLTSPPPT